MDQLEKRSEAASVAPTTEGERFEPSSDGPDLAYEHAHRYALAARLVEGLRVLDLACGNGYGRSWLEAASGKPIVSLDRERAVFRGGGGEVCGSVDALPFRDRSFQAVVFFEAIEHIEDPAAALDEVLRVLRPPGLLILSTPDREIYTERAGHSNEHHLRELSREEFESMLQARFAHVSLRGQSVVAGSWVGRAASGEPVEGPRQVEVLRDPLAGSGGPRVPAPMSGGLDAPLPEPVYLLAACATGQAGARRIRERLPIDSWLHDPEQWLVGQYGRLVQSIEGQRAEIDCAADRADAQAAELRSAGLSIESLEKERDAAREVVDHQRSELDAARARAEQQAAELQAAHEAAHLQQEELARARESVQPLEQELSEAFEAHGKLTSQLERSREAIEDQQTQLEASRLHIEAHQAQLEDSRRHIEDQQAQLEAARLGIEDQQAQLEVAREGSTNQEEQLRVAREAVEDQARQLAESRQGVENQHEQLSVARESIEQKNLELTAAREVIERKDEELAVAGATNAGLEADLGREKHLLEDAHIMEQSLGEQLDLVEAHRTGLEVELRRPLMRIARRLLREWDRLGKRS